MPERDRELARAPSRRARSAGSSATRGRGRARAARPPARGSPARRRSPSRRRCRRAPGRTRSAPRPSASLAGRDANSTLRSSLRASFGRDDLRRVEVLHLAGDAHRAARRCRTRLIQSMPLSPATRRLPGRRRVEPERRDRTDAGDRRRASSRCDPPSARRSGVRMRSARGARRLPVSARLSVLAERSYSEPGLVVFPRRAGRATAAGSRATSRRCCSTRRNHEHVQVLRGRAGRAAGSAREKLRASISRRRSSCSRRQSIAARLESPRGSKEIERFLHALVEVARGQPPRTARTSVSRTVARRR